MLTWIIAGAAALLLLGGKKESEETTPQDDWSSGGGGNGWDTTTTPPPQTTSEGYCTSQALFGELWDGSALHDKYGSKPYGWGKTGPSQYDCSGLFYAAAQNVGCSLPRLAREQAAVVNTISESDAMYTPGAFIFLKSKAKGYVSHVEMSVGNGSQVIASWSGSGTKKSPQPWGWWKAAKYNNVFYPATYGVLAGWVEISPQEHTRDYWMLNSGM